MAEKKKSKNDKKSNKEAVFVPMLSTNPTVIPTDPNRPQPSVAYMLEVSLDIKGGRFLFNYTGLWKKNLAGSGNATKHAEFLAWVEAEVKNPTNGGALSKFDSTPNKRKPSKMSFNCKELIYLVIRLADGLNWRFTADGPPISMDSLWAGKNVFFNATNLDAKGKPGVPTPDNAYKHAYVIIDCPKGMPGGQNPTFIEARFNLHVDLMEGSKNSDPYVPIIIDPDVRNPGGGGG